MATPEIPPQNMNISPSAASVYDSTELPERLVKRLRIEGTPDTLSHVIAPRKTRRVPRNKGGLARFIRLPLEVMTEVFQYLEPLDILHISWADKCFHAMLMRRSAAFVWKQALLNVPDLPPLPVDMHIIHYIKMAFTFLCTFCGAQRSRTIEWRLRCRLCHRCVKDRLDQRTVAPPDLAPSPEEEVPFPGIPLAMALLFRQRDGRYLMAHRRSMGMYVVTIKGEVARLRDALAALPDDDARTVWKRQRGAEIRAINDHAAAMAKWSAAHKRHHGNEVKGVLNQRVQDIVDRLTELGWGEEVAQIPKWDVGRRYRLEKFHLVNHSLPLSDTAWLTIKSGVIEFMEETRKRRLFHERARLVDTRKAFAARALNAWKLIQRRAYGALPFLTEAMDFVMSLEVNAILELPSEVDVSVTSFADILCEDMHDIQSRFHRRVQAKLHARTQAGAPRIRPRKLDFIEELDVSPVMDEEAMDVDDAAHAASTARFHLATATFRCFRCSPPPSQLDIQTFILAGMEDKENGVTGAPHWFPEVMAHACCTRRAAKPEEMLYPEESWEFYEGLKERRRPWAGTTLFTDKKMAAMAGRLVMMCGGHPLKTTSREMDALDARFKCGICSMIMGWRTAVEHHGQHKYRHVSWRHVIDDELSRARVAERHAAASLPHWTCMRCLDMPAEVKPMNLADMYLHVSTIHHVADPAENQDYCRILEPVLLPAVSV